MMHRLLLMAKAPTPGYVKTRLTPPLSARQAAALYRAMLRDTIDRLQALDDVDVYVAVDAPADAIDIFPSAWQVFPQCDGSLGDRLADAWRVLQTRAQAFGPVLAIGADSPTVPLAYMQQGWDALMRADMVLGPTTDGGCYAIGLRAAPEDIFDTIYWSTHVVYAQLRQRMVDRGRAVATLSAWYDIDTPADIQQHWDALTSADVPQTRGWLQQHWNNVALASTEREDYESYGGRFSCDDTW
jgi:uncharacterized protein